MSNFWKDLKKPFFVLAPMADVTDMAFRQVIIECGKLASSSTHRSGPNVLYTEFVSAAGLCSEKGRPKLLPHFKFGENERPIVAQIFGKEPKQFYECAKLIAELGFDGIDINMGCPDRKVVKQGAGIALCKTPELALEVIAATKKGAPSLPVSIKTRLGFDKVEMSWIETLLKANIAALTIHLRTMKEMSKVPAHWELAGEVAKLAKSLDTVVIGNGDVSSRIDGIEKAEQSGLDGIMVGRGIFTNPWFFNPIGEPKDPVLKNIELARLLKLHINEYQKLWGDTRFDPLKRFFKIYVHDKHVREQLMNTKNVAEAMVLIDALRYN